MTMTNEREAFEARFHMLDRSTTSNAWGEFRFLHQPVQDLWEGWKARAAIAEQPQGEDRMRRALTIIANWSLPPTGKFWDEEKTRPTSYEAEYGSNGAREYMKTLAAQALLASPIAHPQPTERSAELEAVQRDAWVSVGDERKPALGQVILMWVYAEDEGEDDDGRPFNMDKSQVQMGEYRDMGHGPFFDCFATPFADHEGVTHWMPLPSEPIAAAPQKGEAA